MKRFLPAFLLIFLIAACAPTTDWRTETFTESLGDTESIDVVMNSSFQNVVIQPLRERTNNLIEGEAEVIGDFIFEVTGDANKDIIIAEDTNNRTFVGDDDLTWSLDFNRDVPMNLRYTLSSGQTTMNLANLLLTGLNLTTSSGSASVVLPAMAESYNVTLDTSSGSISVVAAPDHVGNFDIETSSGRVELTLRENSRSDVTVDISSGAVVLNVPEGAPVRVEVTDNASGNVSVPEGYELTSGDPDGAAVWESAVFGEAGRQINITAEISSGALEIR